MEALRYVGSGQASHYLGTDHTQANFKTAFWRSEVLDYKPFEQWQAEGERDTAQIARERVTKLLNDYQKPAIDPAIEEALAEFVAKKKASMPDAFM
jgi:trimethylamine--corrinoid protein Co-methyltransferase